MPPAVSVVIPVYAVEQYLAACLDSLLAQTEPDWEAVVVIDGSPDGSEAIARDYAARDARLRVIVRENGGLGAARNTGLDAAAGDYLAFLDSDDLLAPRALEQLLAAAREDGADLVLGAADDLYADGRRSRYWTQRDALHRRRRAGLTAAGEPRLLLDHVAWAKLYRREWYAGLGIRFPEGVHTEDLVPWAQAVLRARSVSVVPEVVSLHRRHAAAISADYLRPRTLRDWAGQSLEAIRAVEEQGTPEALRGYLREFVAGQWMTRGREYDQLPDPASARLLADHASEIARLVRRAGVELPPEAGGLLAAVAKDWAADPPRDEAGESLNPVTRGLAADGPGVAERARRLLLLHGTGRAAPAWERAVFERFLLVPLARLDDASAAVAEPVVAEALRAVLPWPRRLALVPGQRARLGAVLTGQWSTAALLRRAVEARQGAARRPSGIYRGRPLVYYPAWDTDNPFLTMLHLEARGRMREVEGLSTFYRLLRWLRAEGEPAFFHLHWTAPIIDRAQTAEDGDRVVDEFLAALDAKLAQGTRLIWTVHNVLPHDSVDTALGRRLHQALAERASVVHVLTRGTQEAIGDVYELPADRTRYIPHASYHGVYGVPLPAAEARARLGIAEGEVAVLVFGRLRPYKGLDAVVDSLLARQSAGQRLHLLVAGKPTDRDGVDRQLARLAEAGVPVTAQLDFVAEAEVAAWFSAADVVALPYSRVLNSGTALLAVAYATPAIMTRSPSVEAEYADQPWARLIDPDRIAEQLADALAEEWYRDPAVCAAALGFAAGRPLLAMARAYADLLDELDPPPPA